MDNQQPFDRKIQFIKQATAEAETTLEATGTIIQKDREEFYIKSTRVYQLSEYAKDENLYLSLASLFAGAFLGVIVNWATAEKLEMTKAGWVALVLFAAVTLIFICIWFRAHGRLNKAMELLERKGKGAND
ncbi:MAG: hypothetical protein SF097_25775 [Acidobacteriota bacterium]|nr:hypothetical protein [Acidobacteriota bacterium]